MSVHRSAQGGAGQPGVERRRFPRYSPDPTHLTARLKDQDLPVGIEDISLGGICILADRGFDQDAVLDLEMVHLISGHRWDVSLRVVYVRQRGPATFFVGGAFTEKLGNQEVLALLS